MSAAVPSVVADRLGVVVITASTRPGRFGPVVADWFLNRVRVHGTFSAVAVDLARSALPGERGVTDLDDLAGAVQHADAVAIVTPEYNHSYPGPLKIALDSLREQWRAKPVAFVSYGGLSGGLRAVEHLRVVVAELHMVSIRETVSFHLAHEGFDRSGQPLDRAADAAADRLLDQLAWWAAALRSARAGLTYPTG